MSEFEDLRVAMRAMLTERFAWFKRMGSVEREDLVNAMVGMVSASRHQIHDAAEDARKADERRALTEPCERPCFACGRPAKRLGGVFFDHKTVMSAWMAHHRLAPTWDDDDEEDYGGVNATLRDHANRGHAKDGAHARCALIDAVRDARLDDEYPAFDVPLPAEYT